MKKKQQSKPKAKAEEKPVTLGDLLNDALVKQLKDKKSELIEHDEKKKQAEEARKREEKRLKEKNKSFEELLGESSMNWKDYK